MRTRQSPVIAYLKALTLMIFVALPVTTGLLALVMYFDTGETATLAGTAGFAGFLVYLHGGIPAVVCVLVHTYLRRHRASQWSPGLSFALATLLGGLAGAVSSVTLVFPTLPVIGFGVFGGMTYGLILPIVDSRREQV